MPEPTIDDFFNTSSPYYIGGPNLPLPPGAQNGFSDGIGSLTINGPIVGNSISVPDEKNPLFTVDKDGKMRARSATVLSSRAFTSFETAGRFEQVVNGTGSVTFGVSGAVLATGATQNSDAYNRWGITAFDVFIGNPTVSILLEVDIATASANVRFAGLGDVGAPIDLTNNHIGFKIVGTSLYATQGDGSTESASSALTTLASGDMLDLVFKVNDSSVDYYWRKNLSDFSVATTLTTNMPAGVSSYASFAATNSASATNIGMKLRAASYER